MFEISIENRQIENLINKYGFVVEDALKTGLRQAATAIRTQAVNKLTKITKVPKKSIKFKTYRKVEFNKGGAKIVITTRRLRVDELKPVQTTKGVVFFNPVLGARVLAKAQPKTFIAPLKKRRPFVFARKGKKRYPLKPYPEIPLSEVWRARVGNSLDPLFQSILHEKLLRVINKNILLANRETKAGFTNIKSQVKLFKKGLI